MEKLELLAYIVEHATTCIAVVTGRELRFTLVNRAYQAITPGAPMLGRTYAEVFPEAAAGSLDRFLRVLDTGEPWHVERWRAPVPGKPDATWQGEVTRLPGVSGDPPSALVVIEDVTEDVRAERALRASEKAVSEANARLLEADRRKNEFLAVLSHELRNPLAPIRNSLFILDRVAAGGEQAVRAKNVIERQVAQLSNLVDDLLDITRITRNKIRLQRERLELNDVVRRAVEDNRSLFESSGVHVEVALAASPIWVCADRTRLAQIIGNLLQNATKFTSAGGHTRVSAAAEGTEAAVVTVVDDGVGMGPDVLARLFEPFVQAEQTLERSKGGLGLGLALVRGLAELHGGEVSAHSDGLGKGSEFVLRLPIDATATSQPEPPASSRPASRRRILIIEDGVDAAQSLCEVLELAGHEVAVAHDGPAGLAEARAFRPEVVLCDIGLPGMDGFEVARAFRADAALRSTVMVALSGYARAEDQERAAEAGFECHLAKPPSIELIEQLLAQLGATAQP